MLESASGLDPFKILTLNGVRWFPLLYSFWGDDWPTDLHPPLETGTIILNPPSAYDCVFPSFGRSVDRSRAFFVPSPFPLPPPPKTKRLTKGWPWCGNTCPGLPWSRPCCPSSGRCISRRCGVVWRCGGCCLLSAAWFVVVEPSWSSLYFIFLFFFVLNSNPFLPLDPLFWAQYGPPQKVNH